MLGAPPLRVPLPLPDVALTRAVGGAGLESDASNATTARARPSNPGVDATPRPEVPMGHRGSGSRGLGHAPTPGFATASSDRTHRDFPGNVGPFGLAPIMRLETERPTCSSRSQFVFSLAEKRETISPATVPLRRGAVVAAERAQQEGEAS